MLEQFLSELKLPISAVNILTKILKKHFEHDLSICLEETDREYKTNQNAIIYSIQLVSDDLIRLSEQYYQKMKKEKYK